jgi:heterodisulfide reductase subunit A
VGSRNRQIGRDYCSQVCCKTSIRQANKLLHLYPAAQISIFYLDLQIIGKEFRTQWADLAGRVKLLQGVPAEVLTGHQQDKLTVIREDYESGARLSHHFDLMVLAVGIEPSPGVRDTAALLGATPDEWGFFGGPGASLPHGIYLAGAATGPTDILSAAAQGEIAARKILRDLSDLTGTADRPTIAVLGTGSEGWTAAETAAREGYPVWYFDSADATAPAGSFVRYRPQSRLTNLEGACGRFRLKMQTRSGSESVEVAAIIVADGTKRSKAGFPNLPPDTLRVVDLSTFSDRWMADPQGIPQRIVFWLDHAGPEWKDNGRRTLQLARKLCAQRKTVTVIMDKMLVHGLATQRHYDLARKEGVKFLRLAEGTGPAFIANTAGTAVELREATLPAVELRVACDLVVIPEKILPSSRSAELARRLALALDAEGYLQAANVRHRPVGSSRRGIFFAGGCHEENDAEDLQREVQAILAELEKLGAGVAPQEGLPRIHEGRCVRCLTCLRICPHAAILLKNFRQPEIVPAACFDCGLCVANCPARAIDPLNLNLARETGGPAPETVVFACRRSGALAASEAAAAGLMASRDVRVVTVNCASRLDVETLLAPLVAGSRKILVAACHEGNCRSSVGGRTASAQLSRVAEEIPHAAASLSHHSIAANEPAKLAVLVSGHRLAK